MAMTLDEEISQLQAEVEKSDQDGSTEFGEEAMEAGAWTELVFGVIEFSNVSLDAKREVLRMQGLAEYKQARRILGGQS